VSSPTLRPEKVYVQGDTTNPRTCRASPHWPGAVLQTLVARFSHHLSQESAMPLLGTSSFSLLEQAPLRRDRAGAGPIVVWLRGEHDLSTDGALCATLARAIALDNAGLVLDLSEVEFMAVSTLGVIVRARDFLRRRSSSLTVRAPSASVLRVIDLCRLIDLVGPGAEVAGDALGSWVGVPSARRADKQGVRPIDLRARAVSVDKLAESG